MSYAITSKTAREETQLPHKKFFEMRSGLLNRSAQLRKTGDTVNAGRLDKISDALLRDLTGQKDGASEAYNTALPRIYLCSQQRVHTQLLSDLTATDRNRGLVLDPQNLLDTAFRGGNLSTAKRFDQIRAAGRFLVDEGGLTEAEAPSNYGRRRTDELPRCAGFIR